MKEKVLVVDDEKNIADTLVYALNREGYLVDTAYDGREALIKVEKFKPDVIILDLMLPEIDGYEVCKKYLDGNETAKLSVDEWIRNLVAQLIVITVFYNPEVICIGGGVSEEDWFINKVKEAYKKNCIEFLGADFITTRIDRCKYNNDANILGAIINASIEK